MSSRIKKLKELYRIAEGQRKVEYDENGAEIVRLRVSDDSEFLSPYSISDSKVICQEVAGFIENAVKPLHMNRGIRLVISSNQIDGDEKLEYSKAIKNYYALKVSEVTKKLHSNGIFSIIMTVISAVILTVAIVLGISNVSPVISELVDIAAWVFMWEAVNQFFIERKFLKVEELTYMNLYMAEVEYEDIG